VDSLDAVQIYVRQTWPLEGIASQISLLLFGRNREVAHLEHALPPAGYGRNQTSGFRGFPTDPARLQEALTTSYSALQKAISGLSDADLKAPVKLFGMDFTKQGAIMFLLSDQHEHLGQSIAYARSNGVVPPWSK
jgi:hypothetical protein